MLETTIEADGATAPTGSVPQVLPLDPRLRPLNVIIRVESAGEPIAKAPEQDDEPKDEQDVNNDSICCTPTSVNVPRPTPNSNYQCCGSFCFIGQIENAPKLKRLLQTTYNVPVFESNRGAEFTHNKSVAFVVQEFAGPDFDYLYRNRCRTFGPTILYERAELGKELPYTTRPLYCESMKRVTVCFAGLKDRKEITRLVDLVHFMCGSVRKNFTANVTHVISTTTQSSKYRLAIGMGRPAMNKDWVLKLWELRHQKCISAVSNEMMKYKLRPFDNLKLYFHKFSPEETAHMTEQATLNGALVVLDPMLCSHFIYDPNDPPDNENMPDSLTMDHCNIVSVEWFWVSIQLDVCANETLYYLFGKGGASKKHPLSPWRAEQQQKARESVGAVSIKNESVSESHLSTSGVSYLDASGDASSLLMGFDLDNLNASPKKGMTKRQQISIELLQTEKNYVQVLYTIMTVYKEPLENPASDCGRLLDPTELRIIFGLVPAIYQVHWKIYHEMANLVVHWSEERCIGQVWLKYSEELIRAYPPYINFYEKSKEMLLRCDRTKPRFHAFLKVCQSKPESCRQGLAELIIRPVQRLPSVILLLNDLLKHTDRTNDDYSCLQGAIDELKRVLTYINEDKRKTEGQVKMFDIVNDIENCPPYLLSSQRQALAFTEVVQLCTGFSEKGMHMTFYLFNDCLEVAKKRRSRSEHSSTFARKPPNLKLRRHIELLFLSNIRRVIVLKGFAESPHIFCLAIRTNMGDFYYVYQFLDPSSAADKRNFLKLLNEQIMIISGRINYGIQEYDLDSPDNNSDTDLQKALRKAIKYSKFGLRRLSFVWPSNAAAEGGFTLQRAVSQMTLSLSGTLRRMSKSNLRLPFGDHNSVGSGSGRPPKDF